MPTSQPRSFRPAGSPEAVSGRSASESRATVSGNVPKLLFEFMKYGSGPDGTTYDIEKLHVYTDSYVDVSVGHSSTAERPLGRLRPGHASLLVGASGPAAHPFHQPARRHERRLVADHFAEGRMSASVRGLRPTTRRRPKRPGNTSTDSDFRSPGVAGYGSAIDLGSDLEGHSIT